MLSTCDDQEGFCFGKRGGGGGEGGRGEALSAKTHPMAERQAKEPIIKTHGSCRRQGHELQLENSNFQESNAERGLTIKYIRNMDFSKLKRHHKEAARGLNERPLDWSSWLLNPDNWPAGYEGATGHDTMSKDRHLSSRGVSHPDNLGLWPGQKTQEEACCTGAHVVARGLTNMGQACFP